MQADEHLSVKINVLPLLVTVQPFCLCVVLLKDTARMLVFNWLYSRKEFFAKT